MPKPKLIKRGLLREAKRYYSNLPYHNYNHALKILKNAELIMKRLHKKFNRDVVEQAILFHDAGYHLNHKKKGFKNKEELAAKIVKKILTKLNYSSKHIKKVMKCIIATNINSKPKSIEEKIVRAADVASMKESYKDFLMDTKKLIKEYEKLYNIKVDVNKWKKSQEKIIKRYLRQRIKLSKNYYNKKGKSNFHERVKRNLEKYAKAQI